MEVEDIIYSTEDILIENRIEKPDYVSLLFSYTSSYLILGRT